MKIRYVVLFVITALILTACSSKQSYKPEKINPEVDVCVVCNMSIAEDKFATELITKDGEVQKFDDIGCMVEYVDKKHAVKKDDIAKQYVRDVKTGDWVELEKAYHAYHKDFWTPMANGIVSFSSKQRAEEYINKEKKGELYDYAKLQKHKWSWSE